MNGNLCSIVADTLGLDRGTVQPTLNRDSAENWDSLNHLRLITAVEEAYGVKLTMAEIESVDSVAALERCVHRHTERQ